MTLDFVYLAGLYVNQYRTELKMGTVTALMHKSSQILFTSKQKTKLASQH